MAKKSDTTNETPAGNAAADPAAVKAPPAPPAAAAATPKEATPRFKTGDRVLVAAANGEHFPGVLLAVQPDDVAAIEFTHRGQQVLLTSSPLDPEGRRPDSWRPVPA